MGNAENVSETKSADNHLIVYRSDILKDYMPESVTYIDVCIINDYIYVCYETLKNEWVTNVYSKEGLERTSVNDLSSDTLFTISSDDIIITEKITADTEHKTHDE